jgi:hypothetical protein
LKPDASASGFAPAPKSEQQHLTPRADGVQDGNEKQGKTDEPSQT